MIFGNCAIGRVNSVTRPTITVMIEITIATMGRLMKNLDIGILSNSITAYTVLVPTGLNRRNSFISNDMGISLRDFDLDGILNVRRFDPFASEHPVFARLTAG